MKPLFEMPELLNLSGDPFSGIFESVSTWPGGGCSNGCTDGCSSGCGGGGGSGEPPKK